MLTLQIPGRERLMLEYLVLDYNGTIAQDGELIPGIAEAIILLSSKIKIVVVTADTHRTVRDKLEKLPCMLEIIGQDQQDQKKLSFVKRLGPVKTVAIGNGRNDILMLREATLGIGVIQAEGAAAGVLQAADLVCTSVLDALNVITRPARIVATLRN